MQLRLALLLPLTIVAGCATAAHDRAIARGNCAEDDSRDWFQLEAPPAAAATLRRLAEANPPHDLPNIGDLPDEFWFSLPTSEIMLCRTYRNSTEAGEGMWWQFEGNGDSARITNSNAWQTIHIGQGEPTPSAPGASRGR